MDGERWLPVPGFEGAYEVSDLGRVRSLPRYVRAVSKAGRDYRRLIKGVILAPGTCRGYLIVNLSPAGTIAVHILVAQAFMGAPPPKHEVNHLDGNKHNNHLNNLEWSTKSKNQQHAVALGLRKQAIPVTDGISVWPSMAQAAFEISGDRSKASSISRAVLGYADQAFGRVWNYA